MTDRPDRFVTSADVAARAGVSRSAVSRAFTPGGQVSSEVRTRILRAADELGYRVNRLAQTLHRPRSDLVGVVGVNLANPYIAAQLDALSAALHARGLQCLLMNAAGGAGQDLARLLDYRVRTVVVLSGAVPDAMIRLCAQNGTRMVLINRLSPPSGALADLIVADSAQGGVMAARRLLAAGCRRVGVVTTASQTSAKRQRAQAFSAEIARHGGTVTEWAKGANSYDTGVAAARGLLSHYIDGIFGVTDEIALGVLNTARFELGLHVPTQLCVIGFDDAPVSAWSSHQLTTVHQSLMALTTATIAAVERDAADAPTTTLIPVELTERATVRA